VTRYLLLFDSYDLVLWGALSDERTGLSFVYAAGPCQPAQSFSCPSPLGLATIFYCLRFETSLFVASYDSQGRCYIATARTSQKTLLPSLGVLSSWKRVYRKLFPSNGCCTVTCLHSCYLAMGLRATICHCHGVGIGPARVLCPNTNMAAPPACEEGRV
jgi:hypothetical protein